MACKRVRGFLQALGQKLRDNISLSLLYKALALGVAIGFTGVLLSRFPFMHRFEENTGLGLLFKLRGERQAPSEVVVVSIDTESSQHLAVPDNPDKWPRSLHARLTQTLGQAGARVVVFDVHFIEPRSAEHDKQFADAIQAAGNVVLCEPLKAREIPMVGGGRAHAGLHSIEKIVKPIDRFARPAIATAPFALPRIPFKVNRYWTFKTGAGGSPTLPVVAYQVFSLPFYADFIHLMNQVSPDAARKLPADTRAAVKSRHVNDLIADIRETFESRPGLSQEMLAALEQTKQGFEDPGRYDMLKALISMYGGDSHPYINYYGPPRTIATIPYYKALLLHDRPTGEKNPDVSGKAVFVGLSEILLAERKDSFYTVFSQANGLFIPGVEIAATAFSNILENSHVKRNEAYFLFLILFWGIFVGMICRLFAVRAAALSVIGLSGLYMLLALFLFASYSIWSPVTMPLLVLSPLAFLGAAAIKYSGLLKHYIVKLRMEEELSVARDLQASMLPAECPRIHGYQIAASSTPAREVGGDFFDFIKVGDNKIGLVIADVTGKSVSGALVMSLSRSVLRTISEADLTVGEIMRRANRQIKRDIKTGMFVALLYAILDAKGRSLQLCSAGQTQPIRLSAESGRADFVETAGDTFPLGILEDADYQETRLELSAGDQVVFYTDGIVEAMNRKQEIFGFQNLLDIVQGAADMDAEQLLHEIIKRVNHFTGGAVPHDDVTVIVLHVLKQH